MSYRYHGHCLGKEQALSSARQGMVNVDGIVGFASYCVVNSKFTKSVLEFRLMRISSAKWFGCRQHTLTVYI